MSATASRWGTRDKKDNALTPEEFHEEVQRIVLFMRREQKLVTPGGLLKLPIDTTRISMAVKGAVLCPQCKGLKFALRPHQQDQRFCFGCGYSEPV